MKKKEEFISRVVADEYIMMPVGKTALKFNGLIMANAVSAFIWEHIEEVNNEEEMAKLICQEFDVEFEEAYNDCQILFKQMIQAGWIEN